ncbi:MAG: hypothetical protein HGA98_04250, partial [Deltaproteobacteria bacterium]|nr:hypothetical protein [Deltaproteobacteria bacterium]
ALEVRRSKPYKSYSGHSTLDLRVQRWSARGYSRLLGKTVEYRLSPGRAQPPSSVQALQTTSDFPAHVVVNAVFDLLLGGEVVSEGHGGSAQAFGLTALPPSGSDTFSINSVVEDGGFELEAVFCAAAVVLTTPWQRRLLRIGRFLRLLPAEVVDTLR